MTLELVNIGSHAGDGTGDSGQVPFQKVNACITAVNGILSNFFGVLQSETNAGLTPNTAYPYGDMRRYGYVANADDPTDMTNNVAAMRALCNPAITDGPTGLFYFVNTTGADIGYFNGVIACRRGMYFDLQGSTLNLTATGGTNDSATGFWMSLGDFGMRNGYLNINWATGTSSSSGNAIKLGSRANENYYYAAAFPSGIYDATYVAAGNNPMGNMRIQDLWITSNITGAGLDGAAAIAMTGGLQDVVVENVYINGGGTLQLGIEYEYGFANPYGAVQSTAVTSHMHNARFTNVQFANMDMSVGIGYNLTGAYGVIIENMGVATNGVANALSAEPGEAMYFRPWVGVDAGPTNPATIIIKNPSILGVTNSGLTLTGTYTRVSGSSYLQLPWAGSTAYVLGQTVVPTAPAWVASTAVVLNQQVKNGANLYICTTAGTTASSGGPTGTGTGITDGTAVWSYEPYNMYECTTAGTSAAQTATYYGPSGTGTGITDGTVTWAYVPLNANVDLIDAFVEGGNITGTSTADGILASVGNLTIKGTTIQGCNNSIVLSQECTRFSLDNFKCFGAQVSGIDASYTASNIFQTPRPKRGSITNGYIAGCSQASAGTSPAISIRDYDGITMEGMRFGYEAGYGSSTALGFTGETTQGEAVFIANSSGCTNMRIRNSRVAGSAGVIGFSNNNASSNGGNLIENCTFGAAITTPVSGAWMTDLQGAVQGITNVSTITTNGVRTQPVNPSSGGATGVILQPGSWPGQLITVMNVAAGSLTFAASGSHVADGASDVIAATTGRTFTWNTLNSLWYANA